MSTHDSNNETEIAGIAKRYGFSVDAVQTALAALQRTGGKSAQFSLPELGGSVQWMRGGMTQIGDMFNSALKDRVSRLCADLSDRIETLTPTSAPAADATPEDNAAKRPASEWPDSWGSPSSAGGQNGVRYAFFPNARRLWVEENGKKTVYDTQDHRINGVEQQQGSQSRLAFSTPEGPVDVSTLPVVTNREN